MKGLQTIKNFLAEQGEPVRLNELQMHLRAKKAKTPRDLRMLREAIREQDAKGTLRLLARKDGEFIPYPPPPTKTPMFVALPVDEIIPAGEEELPGVEAAPPAAAPEVTAAIEQPGVPEEPNLLTSPEALRSWMEKHRIKHFRLELRRAE